MNISRRVVISILVTAIALFVGMLFWPFILNNIIQPIALVGWILLRVLFLSIDQKYFWTAVILVVVIFLFRLLPYEQPELRSDSFPIENATITTIGYWRILLTYHDQNVRDEKTLKRELIHLMTSPLRIETAHSGQI
jgi:MFS family permease